MDTAEVRVEYEGIYLFHVQDLESIDDIKICLRLIRPAKQVFYDFHGFLREEIELAREYTKKVANYILEQVEESKKKMFLHLASIYKDPEGDNILQYTLLSRNNFVVQQVPVHDEQQVLHEVQATVLPGQVDEAPSQGGEEVRQEVHDVEEVVHEVPDMVVGQLVLQEGHSGWAPFPRPTCM